MIGPTFIWASDRPFEVYLRGNMRTLRTMGVLILLLATLEVETRLARGQEPTESLVILYTSNTNGQLEACD